MGECVGWLMSCAAVLGTGRVVPEGDDVLIPPMHLDPLDECVGVVMHLSSACESMHTTSRGAATCKRDSASLARLESGLACGSLALRALPFGCLRLRDRTRRSLPAL